MALLLACAFANTLHASETLTKPNETGPVPGLFVNTHTGNLFYQRADVFFAGGNLSAGLIFSYNSHRSHENRGYGKGWILNLGLELLVDQDGVLIIKGDGRENRYERDGTQYIPPPGVYDQVEEYLEGQWRITTKHGMVYLFDGVDHQLLTSVMDRNGLTLQLAYEGDKLVSVVDPHGRGLHLDWTNGMMTRVTDPGSEPPRQWHYHYDDSGHMTIHTDAMGHTSHYTYDQENKLIALEDPLSNETLIHYNIYQAVSELLLPDANYSKAFAYDDTDQSTTVSMLVNGQVLHTSYHFDMEGRVLEIRYPGDHAIFFGWDAQNNLVSFANENGFGSLYSYDDRGNLLSHEDCRDNLSVITYEPVFNQILSFTDKNASTWTYAYDDQGKLLSITDPLNNTGFYTYDGSGNIQSYTDKKGNTHSFDFDDAGHMISSTDPENNTTSYEYNHSGRLVSQTDPLGCVTSYEYDELDRVTRIISPLLHSIELAYDAAGNIVAESGNQHGTVTYGYDAMGRLVSAVFADGTESAFVYDQADNLVAETNRNGHTTTYHYDARNRLAQTTDCLGFSELYTYDPAGNQLTITDKQGGITTFSYNCKNQLTGLTDPAGNEVSWLLDAEANRLSHTNKNGHTTTYVYDALGRLTTTTDPYGNSELIAYDPNGNRTGITNKNGHESLFEYNALNRLVSRTNPLGHTESYAYDGAGNLVSQTCMNQLVSLFDYDCMGRLTGITDPDGHEVLMAYDPPGNRVSVTDQLGNTTHHTYDVTGRLIGVTDALDHVETYDYDGVGNLLSLTDRNNHTTSFEYDCRNQPIRQTDALGNHVVLTYNALGQRESLTDALGHTTAFGYDCCHLVSETDPLGNGLLFDYDPAGNLTSFTNKNGHLTTYAYDKLNRLISVTDALGHQTSFDFDAAGNRTGIHNPLMQSVLFAYDAAGQLVSITDAAGAMLTYTYDAAGNQVGASDPNGHTTTYGYDPMGRLVSSTDPLGHQWLFAYDAAGNRVSQSDKNGNVTTYAFDPLNRRLSLTDALGHTETHVYDPAGNRIQHINKNGETNSFEYDALNRLVETTDPLENSETYLFDEVGNLLEHTNKNGHTVSYAYDELNRLTSVAYPLGGLASIQYDGHGNIVQRTDPENNTTAYTYDPLHRLVQVTGPMGGTSTHAYDAAGNLVLSEDAAGNTTSYAYNESALPVSVINAMGGEITYAYDAAGNRTSLNDEMDHLYQWVYDPLNRLIQETSPLGHTTHIAYDAQGNKVAVQKPDGSTIAFTYDQLNRLIKKEFSDGESISYTYDAMGNATLIDHDGGLNDQITKTYDANNRLTSAGISHGARPIQIMNYQYDPGGNLLSRQDPDGSVLHFAYNDNGWLEQITEAKNGSISYQYDHLGRRTKMIYPNEMTIDYLYDEAGRNTLAEVYALDGTLMTRFAYDYDAVGNRTAEYGLLEDDFTLYAYDELYRLTGAHSAWAGDFQYTYDAAGNRLTETQDGVVVTTYAYDAENRMISDGHRQYAYDANGNLILVLAGFEGIQGEYHYNDRNLLIGANLQEGFVGYHYSGLGDRIGSFSESAEEGDVIFYLNDYSGFGSPVNYPACYNTIFELSMDDDYLARYVHGPGLDEPVSMFRDNTLLYYIPDAIGSIRLMAGQYGAVEGLYDYTPFGDVMEYFETIHNPFRFAGRTYDHQLGVYYSRHRYYDQQSGRFLSKDPLGMVNGTNLYSYVLNNPQTLRDPSGLSWVLNGPPPLELGNSRFGLSVRTGGGGPPNSIIGWEGRMSIRRYPDFELEIQLASQFSGDPFTIRRNDKLYIDLRPPPECYRHGDYYIMTPQYVHHFYFYLWMYLEVRTNQHLRREADEAAGRARNASTGGTAINVLSTVTSLIPGIGNIVGLVGGVSGQVASEITSSNYEQALASLRQELNTSRAGVQFVNFLTDDWTEYLRTDEMIGEPYQIPITCPESYERVPGRPYETPAGVKRYPIRHKPVYSPGPGNYRRDLIPRDDQYHGPQPQPEESGAPSYGDSGTGSFGGPFTPFHRDPQDWPDMPYSPHGDTDVLTPPHIPLPGWDDFSERIPSIPHFRNDPFINPTGRLDPTIDLLFRVPGRDPARPSYGPLHQALAPAYWYAVPENVWQGASHKTVFTRILWE